MDKPGYTPGRGYEQGHVYRAMLSAAPQPTAGGDAPTPGTAGEGQ